MDKKESKKHENEKVETDFKQTENFEQSEKTGTDETTEVLDITTLKEFVDLQNRLQETEQQMKESRTLAKAYLSDMERMREKSKQVEDEKRQQAVIEISKKILPILDNFEKAFMFSAESATIQGFKMIHTQMQQLLTDLGLQEIDTTGFFDPNLHDCVLITPAEKEEQKGKIAQVFLKGYIFEDKIVRHATVRIFE